MKKSLKNLNKKTNKILLSRLDYSKLMNSFSELYASMDCLQVMYINLLPSKSKNMKGKKEQNN
jgi:hypothetical protein